MCHDTIVCIVTGAWTNQGESRYKLYCGLGKRPCGSRHSARLGRWACRETGHDTAGQACDIALHACDTVGAGPATRHTARHDTALCARSLSAPCAQPWSVGCAPVHPTQFWTQCTISVTVCTTVHEHYSQDFSKNNNNNNK